MEGKPSFSGGTPESHQNVSPEVTQWREELGVPVWNTPEAASQSVMPQAEHPQPVTAPATKAEIIKTESETLTKSAIDEALTDQNADIAAVQQMIGHFFEENREKNV